MKNSTYSETVERFNSDAKSFKGIAAAGLTASQAGRLLSKAFWSVMTRNAPEIIKRHF